MTQLSCIYCGRKLQIKGKCTYGKGRCPSCRHIIFIPKRDHVEELSSEEAIVKRANFDYQKTTTGKNKRDWSKLSDEQIKQNLKGSDTAVFGSLLPSYDEITLFTLSFALAALYLVSGKFRADVCKALVSDGRAIVIALLSAVGMFLSFINIFLKREKYDIEKRLMLLFAVFVTAGTGIYSGYIIWGESKGWLLIFPIWNIVNGVILLLFLRLGFFDTDCIVENEFSFVQVLVSITSVGIILGLCNYVFKMHWVMSYSVCICYTITIDDAVHSILGINKNKSAEKLNNRLNN